MTQEPLVPAVRLQYSGGLSAEEGRRLAAITSANRDPAEVFRHILMAFRVFAIRDVKERLTRNEFDLTPQGVAGALDAAWTLFVPQVTPLATPAVGQAYLAAVRAVNGDIPQEVIAELAREHVLRVGTYFHQSSKEALVAGFNVYVNRKVPARVALEKVLQGYGLTMKQMLGLTNLDEPAKIASITPANLQMRIRTYIGQALHQRFETFSRQEAHNLENQANQVAWLWLVEHGQMKADTEKIWITAKDEKVCAVCGPLHGMAIPVTEQFPVPGGSLWVPGAHVNCRCWVRIRHPLGNLEIAKAMYGISYPEVTHEWAETEHPRSTDGRFTDKSHRRPALKTIDVHDEFSRLVRQTKGDAPPETPSTETLNAMFFNPGAAHTKHTVHLPTARLHDVRLPTAVIQGPPRNLPVLTVVERLELIAADARTQTPVTVEQLEEINPAVDLDTVAENLAAVDTAAPDAGVWIVTPGGVTALIPHHGETTPDFEHEVFTSRQAAIEQVMKEQQRAITNVYNQVINQLEADGQYYDTNNDDGSQERHYIFGTEDGYKTTMTGDDFRGSLTVWANQGSHHNATSPEKPAGAVHLPEPFYWTSDQFPYEEAEVTTFDKVAEVAEIDKSEFQVTLAAVEDHGLEHLEGTKIHPTAVAGRFIVEDYGDTTEDGGHELPPSIRVVTLRRIRDEEAE